MMVPSSGGRISMLVPSLLLLLLLSEVGARQDGHADAIYNFGDSLSDTGNFARMGPSLLLSLPYGVTIGNPTGRLSDGLIMLDYFAMKLGLPLVPPYLDKNASFSHGVNFAVAGATALDADFLRSNNIVNPFTNNSIGVQLEWFGAYKGSVCSSKKDCAKMFKNSIFFVGEMGANDFNSALGSFKSFEEMRTKYTPLVINRLISAAEELIEAGAAHLVIPGNIPFGCAPIILTGSVSNDTKLYDEYHCLKPFNQVIKYYNRQLKEAVRRLQRRRPSVSVEYADFYSAFMNLLDMADLYGFDRSSLTKSCCGIGGAYNFDMNRLCGTPEAKVCQSPSKYIFWDGIHMTQEAYKIMAIRLLSDGLVDWAWK